MDTTILKNWVLKAQDLNAVDQKRALGEIIDMIQPKVHRFFFYLAHNHEVAQDYTQETLIRVCEKIHMVQEPEKFMSWVFRMAQNFYMDQVRTLKNKAEKNTTDEMDMIDSQVSAEDREKIIGIRKVLAELKPEEQSLLLLSDLEGYSYAEIAEMMGTTENAIRLRLHRARKVFQEKFNDNR